MADDTDTARRALDERLDRAFEGATPAPITAAVDALIAAVRAEGQPDPTRTPGCDCDQSGNPEPECHAPDCNWRVAAR